MSKKLTKEEAIRRHRLMWNWIADETKRRQRPVAKTEAFSHFGWDENVICHCWCCDYSGQQQKPYQETPYNRPMCEFCPLVWPNDRCYGIIGVNYYLYDHYQLSIDYRERASLARQIANLPERTLE